MASYRFVILVLKQDNETIANSKFLPAGFTHKSKTGLYKWSVSLKSNFGGGQNLRNSTKDTKYDKKIKLSLYKELQ